MDENQRNPRRLQSRWLDSSLALVMQTHPVGQIRDRQCGSTIIGE
jgi:hypothetical protein